MKSKKRNTKDKLLSKKILKKVRYFQYMILAGIFSLFIALFLPWYKIVLVRDDILFSLFGVLNKSFTAGFILFIFLFLFLLIYILFAYFLEKQKDKQTLKFLSNNSIILSIFALVIAFFTYLNYSIMQYGFYIYVLSALVVLITALSLKIFIKKKIMS